MKPNSPESWAQFKPIHAPEKVGPQHRSTDPEVDDYHGISLDPNIPTLRDGRSGGKHAMFGILLNMSLI